MIISCYIQTDKFSVFVSDFGVLKAVLRYSSILKQSKQVTNEDDILFKAVTETFYPIFSIENINILNQILGDLFPNRELSGFPEHVQMKTAITQVI